MAKFDLPIGQIQVKSSGKPAFRGRHLKHQIFFEDVLRVPHLDGQPRLLLHRRQEGRRQEPRPGIGTRKQILLEARVLTFGALALHF